MKEIRILLTEDSFTSLCKSGFINYTHPVEGNFEIPITKDDVKILASGEILSKPNERNFKVALSDLGLEYIKEIIKRSPVYGQLYYEI
jgi:hypothetical protein